MSEIVLKKRVHSETKMRELTKRLARCQEAEHLPGLAIFVAGSYGRLEASEYSDIDLFFIYDDGLDTLDEPNISQLRLFARVIEIIDGMDFPRLSNDGEFLQVIQKKEILEHLGGRHDDYLNNFTARMLMLLEGRPIHNDQVFNAIIDEIIGSYYRDYPDHPEDFRPTFFVNDIIRFWKTLCLNYEHKRNQPTEDEKRKIKQKIKNFKLKYSRLLTCFATIALISSFKEPVEQDRILDVVKMTPLERLQAIPQENERIKEYIEDIAKAYEWFLEVTDVPEASLQGRFSNKDFRIEAFGNANAFGDMVFQLTREIADEQNYLRYLLV